MPPKRRSPTAASAANPPKKGRATKMVPSSYKARWSKVSGSANADLGFKEACLDPAEAYRYVCLCKETFNAASEDDKENEQDNGPPCDGENCLCGKPASENPDHPWIATWAGIQKIRCFQMQSSFRLPDCFGMYTFNDHYGYGVMEIAQNALLDFYLARDDVKAQWSLCEAMAFFFIRQVVDPMLHIDDGEDVQRWVDLFKNMILTMLATLERKGLLKADSEIKNLRVMMAQFFCISVNLKDLLDNNLDAHVLAYANKHKLDLKGLGVCDDDLDETEAEAADIVLPAPDAGNGDPWGFEKALHDYDVDHKPQGIGGDKLDITTWTSAERKSKSFDGRDPLDREAINALKDGMLIEF